VPNDIITRFATHLIIQTIEGAFKISFFEIQPGIRLEGDPLLTEFPANCISSIYVTPEVLEKGLEVLQQQLNAYKEMVKPK